MARGSLVTNVCAVLSAFLLGTVAACIWRQHPIASGLLLVGSIAGIAECLSNRRRDDEEAQIGTKPNASHITMGGWGIVIALLGDDSRLRVIGLLVVLCTSVGMMVSLWPTALHTTTTERQITVDNGDEYNDTSPLPATLRRAVSHSHDLDEDGEERKALLENEAEPANAREGAHDEEAGSNQYHLMTDDGETAGGVDTTATGVPNNQEQESSSRIRGTRRLLQLAQPQLVYLYAGCLVLLVRLPCSLAMPHFVSTTLSAIADQNFSEARNQIVLLFVTGTIDAVLDFWGFFLFGYANQRIVKDLRVGLFHRLLGQDVAFFDQNSSGQLSSRLNSDCSEMAGDLTWFFRFSIESLVRITGITCYMMIRSYKLGLCAISIVPLVAFINKMYGEWLRRNAATVQDALAEANAAAQEALTNIRTVVAFCGEVQECDKYEQRIDYQYRLNIQQLFLTALYYMVVSTFLINTVVQGTLLWLGMRLIEHHGLSPAVLLAFMLYQSQLQNEVLSLMNSYTSLIKSSGAGDKVFALLDRVPPPPGTGAELQPHHGGTDDSAAACHSVSLESVSFRYPSRPENPVLTEFSLDIPKGQTVALVGKSGCGKSTIVNLIQRFYDVDSGRVLIDGIDLRELDLLTHRSHIGVVTQEPSLVSGTLWDNITYGYSDATVEDVHRAARVANAESFILGFPKGYDTTVGERGVQLSGGQKQRIAIARAIVKRPTILLLDEATSALDSESEISVQAALDDLMQQQSLTVVVVAHRLRTVRNADCIVVLDRGAVVESGTHQQLVSRANGVYRAMVECGTDDLLNES